MNCYLPIAFLQFLESLTNFLLLTHNELMKIKFNKTKKKKKVEKDKINHYIIIAKQFKVFLIDIFISHRTSIQINSPVIFQFYYVQFNVKYIVFCL